MSTCKIKILTLLTLLYCPGYSLFSQPKARALKTEISEVTVFQNNAQVFEKGKLSFPAGKNTLNIGSLSPYIDSKSIQVKAKGNFTILSVNYKLNYLNEIKRNAKTDSLSSLIDNIIQSVSTDDARLLVLSEKQNLLNENRKVGTSVTPAQLKQAMDFYEAEVTRFKTEEISLRKSIG